jgi:hypothetical protein
MWDSESDFDKALTGLKSRLPDLTPKSPIRENDGENPPVSVLQTHANPQARASKQQAVDVGRFFQVPYRLFSSGLGAKIGPSAGWLYMALLSHANDNHSLTFAVSSKALASDTGMAPRTIGEAKKKLKELGLIEYSAEPGHKERYTLKKPELERVKRDERPRKKQKPRGRAPQAKGDALWAGLPQILRGTRAKYAQPSRKICAPV